MLRCFPSGEPTGRCSASHQCSSLCWSERSGRGWPQELCWQSQREGQEVWQLPTCWKWPGGNQGNSFLMVAHKHKKTKDCGFDIILGNTKLAQIKWSGNIFFLSLVKHKWMKMFFIVSYFLLVFLAHFSVGSGWNHHYIPLTAHRLLRTEVWQGLFLVTYMKIGHTAQNEKVWPLFICSGPCNSAELGLADGGADLWARRHSPFLQWPRGTVRHLQTFSAGGSNHE